MIENSENITIDSVQDDLCIILEEILLSGRPTEHSMEQALYAQEQLTKLISSVDDINYAHTAANLLKTVNIVLNTFSDDNKAIVKVAKPYGKYNSHVSLPGSFTGKNVLITEIKD